MNLEGPATWLVDLVLLITVVEGVLLALYHRLTGRGVALAEFGWNMVSGLCLMLALRLVLGGAPWPWMALALLVGGLAHWCDVYRRWRGKRTDVSRSAQGA